MIFTAVRNGVLTLLERVEYTNGKVIERTLDSKTRVPVHITTIKEAQ